VRLAETWDARSTEANRAEASAGGAGDAAIPDAGALEQGVGIGEDIRVERAELRLQLSHEKIGDLRVTLVSPGGTESVLLDRLALGEYAERDTLGFTFTSTQFLWEGSRGDWTLRVEDAASGAAGVLEGWTLTVHGAPASPDSAHVFTDEYAASVAADPARGTLRDAGGTDTLNAAAVTAASSIDLRPGAASEIAGAGLAILGGSWIENAEGGDGGDLLRGNELDNRLRGWRGDDSLEGGAGDDRLFGGGGDDIAVYDGPAARFVLEALPDGQLRVRDTAGALGTDILSGVERLGFTDGPVAAVAPETVIA
jgi:subtilisin-like proprotein convertase family protein